MWPPTAPARSVGRARPAGIIVTSTATPAPVAAHAIGRHSAPRSCACRLHDSCRLPRRLVDLDAGDRRRIESPLGILLETAAQQPANRRRSPHRQRLPIGLVLDDPDQHVRERFTRKRPLSGEHLEQHAAESPDVRAFVDRQSARLFRAHVSRGSKNPAAFGDSAALPAWHRLPDRRAPTSPG